MSSQKLKRENARMLRMRRSVSLPRKSILQYSKFRSGRRTQGDSDEERSGGVLSTRSEYVCSRTVRRNAEKEKEEKEDDKREDK